ncbi:regulatory protein [Actinoplanes friuliensis DSM 7358]|jgi:PPM family protein phosphatase|uniref:Regulatory protein n=2 Tax=Actinoplanes friuliensis TaxID=196914 RepID=U5W768_9ACTN|nr:regulatory protein [Actinoplanes friuliensis DSM 7358]
MDMGGELLTIGAFARAARLSPKALRLYDNLGLLRPAAVDVDSGYRYYAPAQLGRARLVAWLRRIGMPLARIQEVCDLPGPAAAAAITAHLAEAEAELADRKRLAGFLVDHLTGKGTPMSENRPTLGLRFAARSETGKVRETNHDIAYAGSTLLAVADGSGPSGTLAATAAVDAFRALPELTLDSLAAGLRNASAAVEQYGDQSISTLTALLWSGSRVGVVHIGDTRAYLLRGGVVSRFTDDHSYVQTLVDEGRLDAADLLTHPQRPVLVRALGANGEADISLRTAVQGDRYLLCSDGLWAVVDPAPVLSAGLDPSATVNQLVDLALDAGAPDNIACVVADVVPV